MAGYKDPPKANRFKPGQSGNPRGRPADRKYNLVGDLFHELYNNKITFVENGVKKKMTAIQLINKQLMNKAIRGDLKAAELLYKTLKINEIKQNEDEGSHEFFVRLHAEKKKEAEEIIGRKIGPGEDFNEALIIHKLKKQNKI